jgi:hypothetical protein
MKLKRLRKIQKKYRNRFKFSYHTKEDIEQEIALHYLLSINHPSSMDRHIYNRLSEWKRDKYDRETKTYR